MKTNAVLNIMRVVSWIIFIGLCIKAGALMISSFVSLFINGKASGNLYLGLDLSTLYKANETHYWITILFIIAVALLKAYIFYLILKLFSKLNLNQPFNLKTANLITNIAHVSLVVGVIAVIGNTYTFWLIKNVAFIPYRFGSSEFLFMAGVVLIISFLYKRGVEIQSENELTI